jgi:hypothetical protein
MTILKNKLEHALRVRGFNDGYAGHEKAFPKERSYLDSYQHGREAKAKEVRRRQGRSQPAEQGRAGGPRVDGKPLAPPLRIPPGP